MTKLSYDNTDLDAPASESRVVHESVTNTDHDDASTLKQGWSVESPVQAASLAWHVPLQEDSGSTVYDLSGNNLDGSASGPTPNQTGIFGTSAWAFDGSGDNVSFGDSDTFSVLESGDTATITGWVYLDTESDRKILEKNGEWAIRTTDNTAGNSGVGVRVDMWGDNTGGAISDSDLPVGEWTHIAVKFDAGNSITYFKNGTKQYSYSTTTTSSNSTATLYMGSSANSNEYWPGRLYDFRLYNSLLSASDIESLAAPVESTTSKTPITLADAESVDGWGVADSNVTNPILDEANLAWSSYGLHEYGNITYNPNVSPPYKWWVSGTPSSGSHVIGYVYSSDGYSWTDGGQCLGTDHQDPWTILPSEHSVDSSTYYMYVETQSTNEITRVEGTGPASINNNETLIVPRGASGAWDDKLTGSPIVFEWNGTWYCMYEGIPSSPSGYAGASIGITTADTDLSGSGWTKDADNPILQPADLGSYAGDNTNGEIVCDQLHRRSSDGRWFLAGHGNNHSTNKRFRYVAYSDVDPQNWTDGSDWTGVAENPVEWDRHGRNTNHMHTAAVWDHPDDNERHMMINAYKASTIYQDRWYTGGEDKRSGSLITSEKVS